QGQRAGALELQVVGVGMQRQDANRRRHGWTPRSDRVFRTNDVPWFTPRRPARQGPTPPASRPCLHAARSEVSTMVRGTRLAQFAIFEENVLACARQPVYISNQ